MNYKILISTSGLSQGLVDNCDSWFFGYLGQKMNSDFLESPTPQ